MPESGVSFLLRDPLPAEALPAVCFPAEAASWSLVVPLASAGGDALVSSAFFVSEAVVAGGVAFLAESGLEEPDATAALF